MSRISITTGATAGGTRRAATHYGRRTDESAHISEHHLSQNIYKQVTTFNFAELPSATLDELHQRIPAGSRVLSATLKVTEDWAADTATVIIVGLVEPDGTPIDADGLIVDTPLPSAGAFVDGDGALVGASVGLAVDAQVLVTSNAEDLTAGEATLVVEYEKPEDRNQEMNG